MSVCVLNEGTQDWEGIEAAVLRKVKINLTKTHKTLTSSKNNLFNVADIRNFMTFLLKLVSKPCALKKKASRKPVRNTGLVTEACAVQRYNFDSP